MLCKSMSLRAFFHEFYAAVVMESPTDSAKGKYLLALAHWERITGDPPLDRISAIDLATFKAGLAAAGLAVNTVRGYCDHIQWVLDQAGPPAAVRRLRTAAGLLDAVPWTKPPRRQTVKKEPTSSERIVAIYLSADNATIPRIVGITAGAWWRALISTMASTSLRIGQLVEAPYSSMYWDAASPRLVLPASVCRKSRSDETHPLLDVAFRDLLAIRGERALLFPAYPQPHAKSAIFKQFHRLEKAAGLEPSPGVAFHGIRRRVLTDLAKQDPSAAQLAAGHASFRTTLQSYVGAELLSDALPRTELSQQLKRAWASGGSIG